MAGKSINAAGRAAKKTNKNLKDFSKGIGLDPKNGKWLNLGKVIRKIVLVTLAIVGGGSIVLRFAYSNRTDQSAVYVSDHGSMVSPRVLGDSNTQVNNFITNEIDSPPRSCQYEVCDDFTDLSKWSTHPNLQVLSTQPLSLMALNDDRQRGGVIFLKDYWFKPDLTLSLEAAPCGVSQANLVISFNNQVEYIVGEASYDQVALKSNGEYVVARGRKYTHVQLTAPIKACSMLRIHMQLNMNHGSHAYGIKSWLTFTDPYGVLHEQEAIPEFVIPVTDLVWSIQGRIGVGLKDWKRVGDITATFKSLEIQSSLH